jgi:hypothetical protein
MSNASPLIECVRAKLAVAVLVLAALGFAPAAAATPPQRFSDDLDLVRFLPGTSSLCGFPVYRELVGRVDATLFFDENGAIVREDDYGVNVRMIYSAPTRGTSFEWAIAGSTQTYYTDGAAPGSAAAVVTQGLVDKVPGSSAAAGQSVYEGTVIDFDSVRGLPEVDYGPFSLVATTAKTSTNDTPAARCAALLAG